MASASPSRSDARPDAPARAGETPPVAPATRARILEVAAGCFAKQGFRGARMVEIARRSGLSRAALYKHFPTKEALLLALNEYVIDEWLAFTRETLAGEDGALDAIARWVREGLQGESRLAAVRVVTAEETQGALLTDRGATLAALDAARGALEAVLRRGMARGELRSDLDVARVARALQAVLLGLLRNHVSERPIVDMRDPVEVETVVAMIVSGLEARRETRR